MKKILLLSLLLYFTVKSPAQVYPSSDCMGAIPVCSRFLTLPPHAGEGQVDDLPMEFSCISSGELNSIWLRLVITRPGLLGFNIIPGAGPGSQEMDLDFAVFNLTGSVCASISENNEVACNYSGMIFPTPVTGLNNGPNPQDSPMLQVNAGQTYYILINNFRGSSLDIQVDFSLSTCEFCAADDQSSVSGYVYMDRNGDCVKDASDWPLANQLVRLIPTTPDRHSYAGMTNTNGYYLITRIDTGSYHLIIGESSLPYEQTCPQQEDVLHLNKNNQRFYNYNLGYNSGTYNDGQPASSCARGRIEQNEPVLRRCFSGERVVTVYNEGNAPLESIYLILRYDENITLQDANTYLQNPEPGVWKALLPRLVPGRPHIIRINEQVSCTAPLSGTVCVEAELTQASACGPLPPESTLLSCGNIVSNAPPNDKTGFPLGEGDDHTIRHDQELRYRIRFQNTGNDMAFTITVRDTLTHLLDEQSVKPGISSHPYIFQQDGNRISFSFHNIRLPGNSTNSESSQGFVEFSVKQKASNPTVYQVVNTASIYFDFNEPIHTQPSIHSIDPTKLSLPDDYGKERRVLLYPNPAKEGFAVRHSDMFISLRLTDLRGRLLLQQHNVHADQKIATGGLESGVYLVQLIRADRSFHTERLVVE